MSAWLSRPRLIDRGNDSFTFPNLRLEKSASHPDLLSPFAHIVLQAQLAQRVSLKVQNSQDDLRIHEAPIVVAEVEEWINALPPVFRITDPDTSLDERYPYFKLQRGQLHIITYMNMLDPLKPYLTRSLGNDTHHDRFRAIGIDFALRLLEAARHLFHLEFPVHAKYHLLVFCIFDTATTLCSALLHDREGTLPQRDSILGSLTSAVAIIRQLASFMTIGASSYRFLQNLLRSIHALPGQNAVPYCESSKRRKTGPPTPPPNIPPHDKSLKLQKELPAWLTYDSVNPGEDMLTVDDFRSQGVSYRENDFETYAKLDIGGMEQMIDWDALDLDTFLNEQQIM